MFDSTTRILIADDSVKMRKLLVSACREIGFRHFVEAQDGKVARETLLASGTEIDLVICDWNMPHQSGLEILRMMRTHEVLKTLPILLMTSSLEQKDAMEAIRAGVNGFVITPFTTVQLSEKLSQIHKKLLAS